MKTRRWDFVSVHADVFGVQRICRVLRVSRSGCYRWLAGAKSRQERQAADDALLVEIREIRTEHKDTYGVRRVHAELRGLEHTVNRKRVERPLRINRLKGRHLRHRKRTTVPDRLAPPAPDLARSVNLAAAMLPERAAWRRLDLFSAPDCAAHGASARALWPAHAVADEQARRGCVGRAVLARADARRRPAAIMGRDGSDPRASVPVARPGLLTRMGDPATWTFSYTAACAPSRRRRSPDRGCGGWI
ncbi:IS3 family transposase [Streptomyces sp. NPDC021608]|uniref:IS3 family transposase n=1 Tax=Streptomyces sp. NPDC021608 TaxID=3154903 RepID=UPI0033EAFB5B